MSVIGFYHWYRTASSIFVRSWCICAAVLFVTLMRSGLHYSYGEFLVDLRDDFNGSSMTEGNWIGTLVMTTSMTLAPISVSFIRMFDVRGYQMCIFGGIILCAASCCLSSLMTSMHALVFSYSVLQGIGTSVTYMATSLILIDYFDKTHPYHVLGTSILYCGYPLGSVIFNPIYAELVDAYGWRVALRIAAALLLITAFATAPIFVSRYTNEEYDELKQREAKGSLVVPLEQLKRPEVIIWFSVNLTTFLGFYMPIVNLPTYMRDKGYQGAAISMAVTVLSFAEIVAYIAASLIGDYLKGRLIVVNLISSLALVAIYFVWPSVDEAGWVMIVTLSVGSGLFLGLAIVYTFAETVDITRLPQDQAWGYTNTCSGIGLLLGPLITGGIYDLRQSHDDVFYATGCVFAVQLTLYCCLVHFVHRRDQREQPLFDAASTIDHYYEINNNSINNINTNDYTLLHGTDDNNDTISCSNNNNNNNNSNNSYDTQPYYSYNSFYSDNNNTTTSGGSQVVSKNTGNNNNNNNNRQRFVTTATADEHSSLLLMSSSSSSSSSHQPQPQLQPLLPPPPPLSSSSSKAATSVINTDNNNNNNNIHFSSPYSSNMKMSSTVTTTTTTAAASASASSPSSSLPITTTTTTTQNSVPTPRMYTFDYAPNDTRLIYDK